MTTSVDETLSKVEDLLHDLLFRPQVEAAKAALIAQFPFLGLPIIKQIFDFTIDHYAEKLFGVMRMEIDMGAVKIINAEHAAIYSKAADMLKIVAYDKGIDSKEFQDAKKQAELDFARFISYNH